MDITPFIQRSILDMTSTLEDVLTFCDEALEKNIKTVCIPPVYVENVYEKFKTQELNIVTVVGYPYGFEPASSKVEEVIKAINSGVNELDVVVNINAIKSGMWNKINQELDRVTTMTNIRNRSIKLFIEMHLLTTEEIQKICDLCVKNNVQYIITSTNLNEKVNIKMVEILKNILPQRVKIALTGQFDSASEVESYINAGVSRIITNSTSIF